MEQIFFLLKNESLATIFLTIGKLDSQKKVKGIGTESPEEQKAGRDLNLLKDAELRNVEKC